MSVLRLVLPGTAVVGDLHDSRAEALQALADLYAYPTPLAAHGWVRATMVATLDGSATGSDGRSGSLGGAADRAVYTVLRGLADVVLVGAGTVRAEGYRLPAADADFAERRARERQAPAPALAVVTRSGDVPDVRAPVAGAVVGPLVVVTCAAADVEALRARFGHRRVIVAGEDDVDPVLAVAQLAALGMRRVLLEGGPQLLARHVAARRLDELCLTLAPLLVAGSGPRIAAGAAGHLRLRPAHLVDAEGVLLGRWFVQP